MTIEERHMEKLKKAIAFLHFSTTHTNLTHDFKQKFLNNINDLHELYGYLEAINDQKKKRETT